MHLRNLSNHVVHQALQVQYPYPYDAVCVLSISVRLSEHRVLGWGLLLGRVHAECSADFAVGDLLGNLLPAARRELLGEDDSASTTVQAHARSCSSSTSPSNPGQEALRVARLHGAGRRVAG